MKEIRVGVVGIGHLGNYHLQKYERIPEVKIVGIADVIEGRAETTAKSYNCANYNDYRELIGKVDAVSITVPTINHHKIAKDFLLAGIDVLLEKPITVTLEEANDIISIAADKRAILQVGFVERFNPAIMALGKVLDTPLFIETHRLHPFFIRGTDVDVIRDLMIHDLDIILHFVKSPVKNVEAVGVSVLSNEVDIANARIAFESGCVANITASRITSKTMQKVRFFGYNGYHSVDYGKRELVSLGKTVNHDGSLTIGQNEVDVKMHDPLEEEIRAFIHSIITRETPLVSGEEARKSLTLALQIIGKIREGTEAL